MRRLLTDGALRAQVLAALDDVVGREDERAALVSDRPPAPWTRSARAEGDPA